MPVKESEDEAVEMERLCSRSRRDRLASETLKNCDTRDAEDESLVAGNLVGSCIVIWSAVA